MHFLITAGGTREYIDPVRFISNASSGKMGYALAAAAVKAGHEVVLVTAAEGENADGVEAVKVETAGQMLDAVKERFGECDCLVMAAAVSDYRPAEVCERKIKKGEGGLVLTLVPTVDILKWAGAEKKAGQVVVGFALEDEQLRARAEGKLEEKNLDMIVANGPAAIGAERSTVQIKSRGGQWVTIEDETKAVIAERIIEAIEKLAS